MLMGTKVNKLQKNCQKIKDTTMKIPGIDMISIICQRLLTQIVKTIVDKGEYIYIERDF